ncbi:hypothetical protein HUJ05_011472 [Dendroctonus ponderosae]|nr:hypothetical protein HUJ05_011472 [Dendroctonus ponderosae]
MSINRVQKLLFSEYCDFEDLVLIESPFAQTTKEGRGLRQVHLGELEPLAAHLAWMLNPPTPGKMTPQQLKSLPGLTPSKLILATDILPPIQLENVAYNPCIDPETETFELIAIYPVECVNLSIYRRKRRQAIKARFCNNRVQYFELGGFERRGMFWNLWCEKVKFLCPGDSGTSRSETSVATSTTGSSLYLVDKKVVSLNGIKQLWCKFGPNFGVNTRFINEVVAANSQTRVKNWTDRYLYLGRNFLESSLDYQPIMRLPHLREFVKSKKGPKKSIELACPALAEEKNLSFGASVQVNRFGSGILEGCGTGLYLTFDDYIVPRRFSSTIFRSTSSNLSIDCGSIDYEEIAETAVLLWEYYGLTTNRKMRHRRRYGYAPKPLFLYGLGPWTVSQGDRTSLQLKRALSDVNMRKQNADKELKLPVSKRQLCATVSSPVLTDDDNFRTNNIINAPKKPVIFFWTPGYWYRPISAKDAYGELQKHLKKIRNHHESELKRKRKRCTTGRRFLKRFSTSKAKESDDDNENYLMEKKKRKPSFISNMLGSKFEDWADLGKFPKHIKSPLQFMKRILQLDVELTAWDFDSTTVAQQLTMIDKDLFLKVSPSELSNLLWQQSCQNAPNVGAMIAFSHRISCLTASEILRHDTEKTRARLMARFINIANKCHRISNFHSCRSVLSGLQSPAIFRLRRTWAYVRKKHSSKYQAFEFLCRLYRDPRMPSYQKTFFVFSQNPPYLPYIGHLIAKLFDKVPEYKVETFHRPASRQLSFCTTKSFHSGSSKSEALVVKEPIQPNLFAKIFSVFSANEGAGDFDKPKAVVKKSRPATRRVKFKGLYEYFAPLGMHQDNRRERLEEVTELLEKSQLGALNYNFSQNALARDFLLKTRHFDDQGNFFNSLCMESSSRPNTTRNKRE